MKIFGFILLIFLGLGFVVKNPAISGRPLSTHIDSVPNVVPQLFGGKFYQFKGYVLIDSLVMMPCSDTNMLPKNPSIVFRCQDSAFYMWNRRRWLKFYDARQNFVTFIGAYEGLQKTGDSIGLNRPILRATEDGRVDYPEVYLSLAGSDANNGLTEQTPKLTISALNTAVNSVAAYRGQALGAIRANDEYRAMIDLSTANVSISAYGLTGSNYKSPPILNGADIHNSGWTLEGGTSFTYSKAITLSIGSNFNYDYPLVIEIDTILEKVAPFTARRLLTAVSTLSAVETTTSSFFYANLTNPVTIYIHPTTGAPGNNRYRYEVATRRNCVSASTSLAGVNLQRMILLNSGGGYGVLGAATGGGAAAPYVSRTAQFGAGTHLVVSQGGTYENNVFIGAARGLFNGSIAGAFYKDNGTGVYGTLRKNIFIDQVSGWTAHESPSVTSKLERVVFDANYFFGDTTFTGSAFGSEFVRRLDITNNFIDQATNIFISAADTLNVVGNTFRNITDESRTATTSTKMLFRENLLVFTPPSSGLTRNALESTQVLDTMTVEKNIIHAISNNDQATASQILVRTTTAAAPTVTRFNYNVIIGQAPATRFTKIFNVDQNSTAGLAAGMVSDFNVFILVSGAGFQWTLLNPFGGGDPNAFTLSNWQSRSGQDANSIFIDLSSNPLGLKQIYVDPDNGNWTLRTTTEANQIRALLAGMTNPPRYYPAKPSYEQAVATIFNTDNLGAAASTWQFGQAVSGGSLNAITALTGDVVATGPGSVNAELSNTAVTPGTYTLSTVTVDEDGRVTSAANGSVTPTDTTRFWHVSGNNLGGTGKLGALTGHTTTFISHNIMRAAIRAVGGFVVGDTTGLTATKLVSFRNTTELQGVDVLGPVSGTSADINIQTAHTATANNQVLASISFSGTVANGGFTGVSARLLDINASFPSGTIIGRVGNIGASGTSEFRVEDPLGAARILSTGGFWATGTDAFIRPASSSFSVRMERSTGVTTWIHDSTGQHTGGSTRPLQKFRVSGNAFAASQGVTGAQAAFVAGVFQNTSTAAAGTVTHASVIGIGQSTLASTNSITTTNASSLYIENAPLGSSTNTITNPYAFYVNAGKAFYGGGVLHAAGTSAIAPLQFTSGTDHASPAAGMWFYNGTRLGFSPSTTIKRVALTNDAAPSNGQIPIGNGTDYTAANITSNGFSIVVTNGAGTINIETAQTLDQGTYSPTLTSISNVDATTTHLCHYYRVGNVVTVSGAIDIDPTTTATLTQATISLPIASLFADDFELAGTSTTTYGGGGVSEAATLRADPTNEVAEIRFNAVSTSNQRWFFMFTYRITPP